METHIEETVKSLINYRDLFILNCDYWQNANNAIILLIKTFAPYNQIDKYKVKYSIN